MKQTFERVILFARQYRASSDVRQTLTRIVDFLKQQHINAYVDDMTAVHFDMHLPVLKRADMGRRNDVILVVGGDGSMLAASRMAVKINVPVIGINRGRLGFLTDIPPKEIADKLLPVIHGQYQEERRFLLQTKILDKKHHVHYQSDALNEVVLSRGQEAHLVDFEMYINEQYVCHYRADGLIVTTPTGSTAYALSAGGPIMHPQLNAIGLVPMFPHTLSSRPLVVDSACKIDLIISHGNDAELLVSCDGHESHPVKPGQCVSLEKLPQQLRLLHPEDYHYYDTLRIKLGWQSKYHSG